MARENVDIVVRERGSRVVRRNIAGIGASATAAQRGVSLLKGTLLTLGVGFTLVSAIQTLASFSQEMSTVRAITGATEEQFNALEAEAKRLGVTTRFSATQAAEGAAFLARAGFETSEVLESLESTLTLAQAGALDLGSAADIASNVLQGFRLRADEAQRAVDVLARAANSSNTNVQQLGEAMKFVAPVAAGLGVTLEETTAAVGALSNAGLQASMAGTGLRRVLAELESPTDKSREILNQFGLKAEDVRVTSVGLTQALQAMRDAGIDTGTALEIFGQRGGPAFEVLSSSIPDIQELNSSLRDSEGAAKEMADIMDENLNGSLLALKSAVQGVVLELGTEGLEGVIDGATEGFRAIAAGLNDLDDEVENVTGQNRIEFWMDGINSAVALTADILHGASRVILTALETVGQAIGATAAAVTLLLQGEFSRAWEVSKSFGDITFENIGNLLESDLTAFRDALRDSNDEAEKLQKTLSGGAEGGGDAGEAAADSLSANLQLLQQIDEKREQMMKGGASQSGLARGGNPFEAYGEAAKDANEEIRDLDRTTDQLGFTFTSAFENAILAGRELSDVLRGLAQDIARIALRKGVTEPLGNALAKGITQFFGSPAESADGNLFTSPALTTIAERGQPEAVLPLERRGGKLGVRASGGGGGGGPRVVIGSIDMRGAEKGAVVRLEQMLHQVNASIEPRAISAVTESRMR